MTNRLQYVLICYGDQLGYHHGAKYQILKSYDWYQQGEVCVVTDKPSLFEHYPVRVLTLDESRMHDWTLRGTNHFGVKLLGMKWAIDTATQSSKSMLLDTDMYWKSDPSTLAEKISNVRAVLYENEGHIFGSKNKSIKRYEEALAGVEVRYDIGKYEITSESEMWRSSIVAMEHSQRGVLDDAFALFKALSPLVKAHTIEQFALGETMRIQTLKIGTGKHLLENWSSTGKKNYVTPELATFFNTYGEHDFEQHLKNHTKIKIRRPLSIFLKQKLKW